MKDPVVLYKTDTKKFEKYVEALYSGSTLVDDGSDEESEDSVERQQRKKEKKEKKQKKKDEKKASKQAAIE